MSFYFNTAVPTNEKVVVVSPAVPTIKYISYPSQSQSLKIENQKKLIQSLNSEIQISQNRLINEMGVLDTLMIDGIECLYTIDVLNADKSSHASDNSKTFKTTFGATNECNSIGPFFTIKEVKEKELWIKQCEEVYNIIALSSDLVSTPGGLYLKTRLNVITSPKEMLMLLKRDDGVIRDIRFNDNITNIINSNWSKK